MKTLTVQSLFGKYQVSLVSDLRKKVESVVSEKPVHLLIDQTIWSVYPSNFRALGRLPSIKIFPAIERRKNLDSVVSYVKFLLKHKIKRNHVIMVVGGGLVQDIGSFTAHIILRGINWIFIPTTLLSMADSCIGSKSGINVGKYKNQVGAFHPPAGIYIYPPFLKTLPKKMILDGKGEIIKHAIIKGGKAFNYLTKNLLSLPHNQQVTQEVIYQSLLVKKEIVEEDELEKGRRKLLNYGHTFGHAWEGYTKNKIPHGIAVTIGMDMANFISMRRGLLPSKEFETISKLLHQNIPYRRLPLQNLDLYMDFIAHDKKVIGDHVSLLLCRGIGRVEIIKVKLDRRLHNSIAAYLASYSELRNPAYKLGEKK